MIEQGTTEWKQQRLGKVTASRVSDVVARIRTGWGASRANYQAELLCERLTGVPAEHYTNGAMQWGIDTELQARLDYQMMFDVEVEAVGFVPHPFIEMAGASPDGLVGKDGLVEFKCPNTATHIATLLGGSVPGNYVSQVQFQLACTGRQWCDWVSFDPRLPPSMQLFCVRIHRDQETIESLDKEVTVFLAELDAKLAELRSKYEREKAA
jgi:predicted phage-related endonuclease